MKKYLLWIFSVIKKLKGDKTKSLTNVEKKLLKDKSFVKALRTFNKDYEDFKKSNAEVRKRLGLPPSKYLK